MTQEAKLLPCPFCGGNFVAQGASNDRISVWCGDCGARGPDTKFPEDCMPGPPIDECRAAWNRRALTASMRDEGEASARQLWQELLEKDDRTSPAEYPDMALITFDEFAAALRRNAEPPVEAAAPSEEPVAWMFELANSRDIETDEPCNWGRPQLSFTPPSAGKYQRNVRPLVFTSPAVAPVAVSVKAKPLEWGEERRVPDGPWSETMLRQRIGHHNLGQFAGSYSVQEMDAGGAWGWWNTWTSGHYPEGVEPTEEAAKAAAQADFNARILSSIIPATKGGEPMETRGPYEARICPGIPTDCCDYGVVSLSEGREVCRVWREQDARAIVAALSAQDTDGVAKP